MEFEPWWLLAIPLFFALGWFAARADLRQQMRDARRLPDAYFRGLNHLLNEQPDQAIDAFVDVVRLDPEAAELHFALGNLFRHRGESDRAIRVHEHLAARLDLDPRARDQAQFELGQDYLKAGLLDRADAAFARLAQGPFAGRALACRLEIAQMERDWTRAIALGREIAATEPAPGAQESPAAEGGIDSARRAAIATAIVHFHCELAQQAMTRAQRAGEDADALAAALAEARARLDEATALPAGASHPRVWQLRAECCQAAGDAAGAIAAWRGLAEASPAYLAPVARRVLDAWRAGGRLLEGVALLEQRHAADPSVDLFDAIARARAELDGPAAALAWAERALAAQPSLLGLETLLELREAAAAPLPVPAPRAGGAAAECAVAAVTAEADIGPLIRRLIHPQARRLSRHLCLHCGFKGRQFHWNCPGCNRWGTFSPRRVEEMNA